PGTGSGTRSARRLARTPDGASLRGVQGLDSVQRACYHPAPRPVIPGDPSWLTPEARRPRPGPRIDPGRIGAQPTLPHRWGGARWLARMCWLRRGGRGGCHVPDRPRVDLVCNEPSPVAQALALLVAEPGAAVSLVSPKAVRPDRQRTAAIVLDGVDPDVL